MSFQTGTKTDININDDYSFEKDKKETAFAEQKGFVKYHKSIFVIGVFQIEAYIKLLAGEISKSQENHRTTQLPILSRLFKVNKIWDIIQKKVV